MECLEVCSISVRLRFFVFLIDLFFFDHFHTTPCISALLEFILFSMNLAQPYPCRHWTRPRPCDKCSGSPSSCSSTASPFQDFLGFQGFYPGLVHQSRPTHGTSTVNNGTTGNSSFFVTIFIFSTIQQSQMGSINITMLLQCPLITQSSELPSRNLGNTEIKNSLGMLIIRPKAAG